MANENNGVRVVQGGVNTSNGNALAQGQGFKVATVRMPVQPKNKPWFPDWHPTSPQNNIQ
jgi:hypothetical protein